jgi:FkbM family methyltransferase
MEEGPYGYIDGDFDVTVKEKDVVIDAGAWIGDFAAYAAYAASKGATVYAFEPVEDSYNVLCKTQKLNKGEIHPVQKGLGDFCGDMNILINGDRSTTNSKINKKKSTKEEKISITTLDFFVKEHKLTKVDFIKADIEGAERDMLKGAVDTLVRFAPKLAICTYHLSDDPKVLEQIILEANPNYKIVHLRHKLLAAVL